MSGAFLQLSAVAIFRFFDGCEFPREVSRFAQFGQSSKVLM
jgi:hypothetical protein